MQWRMSNDAYGAHTVSYRQTPYMEGVTCLEPSAAAPLLRLSCSLTSEHHFAARGCPHAWAVMTIS
eukprot:1161567-Pelagomonas_calceolata.AAC.5